LGGFFFFSFFLSKEKHFSILYEDFEPILDRQTLDFHQISSVTHVKVNRYKKSRPPLGCGGNRTQGSSQGSQKIT
jgi:hypothetical protein